MYDTVKPRTLIIDHGGQVRNIAILGSSGQPAEPSSISTIQFPILLAPTFPPFLSDLKGRTQGVWLCTREKGTKGFPQFLTVALSYIRRDLKSAGGVTVSVGNYSTSLPRVQKPVACCVTRAGAMFRSSRVGLVRSNGSLVEHTFDLVPRRHMMLEQVLPAENMEEHVAVIHPRQARWQFGWVV